MQADALYPAQEFRGIFGLDQPHLQIGASGDLDIAAGTSLGKMKRQALLAKYHWRFYRFSLPEPVLRKIYRENEAALLRN